MGQMNVTITMPREMWAAVLSEAKRKGYISGSDFIRALIRDHFKRNP